MIKPVILAIPNVSCHFIGMGTIFLYRKINRKIIQVNDTIIVTVIISITIKYIKERILNFRCGLSFIL